jgi:Rrf2 family protein
MLRISRKTYLALEAVIDIAYNARPEPVQAKEITARQGVPQRYLEQVMQQLVHAGILRGVRGPRGGYRLARERRRITFGDVVRVAMSLETDDEPYNGSSDLGRQVLMPLILSLQKDAMDKLDQISIEDICQRARGAGLDCGDKNGATADFAI